MACPHCNYGYFDHGFKTMSADELRAMVDELAKRFGLDAEDTAKKE